MQSSCHLEVSQVQDFRSDAEQHALRCAPNEACGVVVDGGIGLVETSQTTLVLILRLIRETTQQHRFLERLKPLCIHTLKVV